MRREPGEKPDALASAVIGAAIEVHRILGPGFLECVYQAALAVELSQRAISFEREKRVAADYKGHAVGDGLLINFNVPILKKGIKRVVLSEPLGDLGVMAVQRGGVG